MKYLFLVSFLCLFFSCGEEVVESELPLAELRHGIDVLIDSTSFNGVVLISQDSTILYEKVRGFADMEAKRLLKLDDPFIIGSISKQITAVLVLLEVENRTIDVDDKIGNYLTTLDRSWAGDVSIHQLLTHTHGIVSEGEPLDFAPGERFQYSQLGYDLLARILERVTGKSFANLSDDLFRKHGLHASFHPETNTPEHLVKGYEETKSGKMVFSDQSLRNYVAAGSFISTATDLVRWNELLHAGKLVSATTLKLMKAKYATRKHPIFGSVDYGYGLLYEDGEVDVQIGAFGYAPGFVSANYYYPDSGVNLVVLENTGRQLNDFKQTFGVHTGIMALVKEYHSSPEGYQ